MGRTLRLLTAAFISASAALAAHAQEPTEASCQADYEAALSEIEKPKVLPEREIISDGSTLYVTSEPPGPFVMEGVRGPAVKRAAIDAAGEAYRECLYSVPLPPNPDGTCPAGTYPVEVTPPPTIVSFDASQIRELKPVATLKPQPLQVDVLAKLLAEKPRVAATQVDPKVLQRTAKPGTTTPTPTPEVKTVTQERLAIQLPEKTTKASPQIKTTEKVIIAKPLPTKVTKDALATDKLRTEAKVDPLLVNRLKTAPVLMKAPKELSVQTFKFEKIEPNTIRRRKAAGAEIKCVRSDTNTSILYSVIQLPKLHMTGEPIRVAFNGGSRGIRTAIYSIAQQWAYNTADPITGERLLEFDFGSFGTNGLLDFHEWSENDLAYQAHIRISFDPAGGYWSYIGTDGGDPDVVLPGEPSMNLAGMDGYTALPRDWVKTIFHEFGHALGLEHEHQHPASVCGDALRLEDDEGYTPTFDEYGMAIEDAAGLQPGVLTYLEHYPNFWSRKDAIFNLAQLQEDDGRFTTAFDPQSVMRYEFPASWYKDIAPDECLPTGEIPKGPSGNDYAAVRVAYQQQLCTDPDTCNGSFGGPFASPESE